MLITLPLPPPVALTACHMQDTSMLFWFNQSDHSVYCYDGTTVKLLRTLQNGTTVTSMAAYNKNIHSECRLGHTITASIHHLFIHLSVCLSAVPISLPCASENRPCSHLCDTIEGDVCSCSQYLTPSTDKTNCTMNCECGLPLAP